MADSIPDELVIEILVRLPVVSLLRFTSVCKSWCSLITSPSYITKHLNHTKKTSADKLLVIQSSYIDQKLHYLLCPDADNFGDEYSDLELPFPFLDELPFLRIVGSCNGVLCLSDHWFSDNPDIFLWNPSIRKSVTLPMPSKPQGPDMYIDYILGFGAHPTTHDCKVVRLAYELESLGEYNVPPKVEIYTQETRSWRCISSAAPLYCIIIARHQAFVNGTVHWLAYDPLVVGDFCNLIASFSMVSETFSEMMLPPILANQHQSMSIEVFGESLAILSEEMGEGSFCIWVMKDYGVAESWSNLFCINLLGIVKSLGFRKNGEVLLATENNCLLSYDLETKTSTNTRLMESSNSLSINTFMETLVW